jgi:hypothetical protein
MCSVWLHEKLENVEWEFTSIGIDINWSRLLHSAILSLWYSRFEVTWLLRDHSKRKTRVRFVYVLPEVLYGDFFIWNKIFSQPRVKYFTNNNQKCYFLLSLFQLRWTLIQHFQVFHVIKPNSTHLYRMMHLHSA